MRKTSKPITLLVILLSWAPGAFAQFKIPPETRNAALRYWQAFGDMQDLPANSDTRALLEQMIAGAAVWDESKLGPVIDANETAIQQMQRATKLPECDWGAEYSAGATASIAVAPKARVMGALNALYGVRQAARGDERAAVATWLAGVRFSQDVASGGSLIFALAAKPALVENLRALTQAVQSGKVSPADRQQIGKAIRALPETGFDWGQAFFLDSYGTEVFVEQLSAAKNPARVYTEVMGVPVPDDFVVPSPQQRESFHKFVLAVSEAYRLPPDQSEIRLQALEGQIKDLGPFYPRLIPAFGMNNQRKQIAAARGELLGSL
ncbi:MAG: hypothetical protein ABSG69_16310 [Candidatus Acidiferrum sp.]|jgi:hypothetical protein